MGLGASSDECSLTPAVSMNIKHDESDLEQHQNRPNPWYPQSLTSSAIAIANQQERNYLQPFPSPTIPKDSKASLSSSCRYSQEKPTSEPFAKFTSNNPETARQQTTPFSIMDPVSISPHQVQSHPIQTNNGIFGGHFNPLGYHMPLHQALNFDSQVRSSALPSPTIYPPTPPPSASWIHPWFIGDSF
ncbi:hypothetical protein HA402_009652 [Bradysia odoriphaga]|nr:hypothetical protein HA402_009652 [Bradysia odoriphaga]